MDSLVAQIKENADRALDSLGQENGIKDILFQILTLISRSNQKDQLALKVSQAVVNSMFATSESPLCREVLSLLLEKLCSLSIVARKDVVWWLVYALDSRKFNVPVIRSLLEVNLIQSSKLDTVLVVAMKNNMEGALQFAVNLLRDVILSEKPLFMRSDFVQTLTYLRTVDCDITNSFFQDFEKANILPVNEVRSATNKERMLLVFTEWVKLLQRVPSDDVKVAVFISQMIEKGVLSETNNVIEFTKAALELSVGSFKESDPTSEVFTATDAFSKLIVNLLVLQDFSEVDRSSYFKLIFSVITFVFSEDQGKTENTFNERPYFRLFSSLLCDWEDVSSHNFVKVEDQRCRAQLVEFNKEFYRVIASFLHAYQPIAFPGFSFAWITLISHRMFLPKMLRLPEKAGWSQLVLLFTDLLKFMAQYTKKQDVPDAVSVVYKGALRVFLAVANDAPEFLVENHYELLNNLPHVYMQLRNVVLSAFPKHVSIPNPYNPKLSIDTVKICDQPPNVFYDPVHDLKTLKKPVDNYLRIPSASLSRTISSNVFRSEYEKDNGIGFDTVSVDVKLINAIVLHVGIEAALEKQRTTANAVFNVKSSYYTLLADLLNDGTTEVRFHVVQAIANQLRYPNAHTQWFNYVLKNFFNSEEWGENKTEIQEIIVRTLLERIVTNKPHCWGIIVTFTDLLKSTECSLMDLPFVKDVPEVELIIKHLSKYIVKTEETTNEQQNERAPAEIASRA